jgi:2-polyprenyl-6-hydroxyphenyl methylase/3-demethylubiquinone-9 3-methyltransferase
VETVSNLAPSTVDPAEITKFSALAAQWWDPSGPFGALHRMNPVRLGYIREVAADHFGGGKPLAGKTALDIGCGGGLVTTPLARMGAKATGLDASAEAIGAARAHAAEAGLAIDFQNGTAEALVETGAQFDLVVALEIIEHVADVPSFLGSASALVEPGGLIVLSTINRTQKAKALAIVGAERILQWAPEGAHKYDKLVTPDEIRAGAPTIAWREPVGISFNPIGSGWERSRDVAVNYLIAGVKR